MAESKKAAQHAADAPTGDGVGQTDQLEPEAQTLQDAEDKVVEQGYRGVVPDPTPNEHYTIDGVTAGKPTPETHPEQAKKAGSRKFTG